MEQQSNLSEASKWLQTLPLLKVFAFSLRQLVDYRFTSIYISDEIVAVTKRISDFLVRSSNLDDGMFDGFLLSWLMNI